MTKTIPVYTLFELKAQFPDAYATVLANWVQACQDSPDVPWQTETMDSLKAVVKACGATLTNWSIGPWGSSHLSVDVEDTQDNGRAKGPLWMLQNVLKPNGYVKVNGRADFPGHCKFTGYCADDNFLESVYKSLKAGESLTDALCGLAGEAERMMEADAEQDQSEDTMLANWGDNEYTAEGVEV